MILPRRVGKGRFDPRPGRPVPASLRVCAAPPEVAVSLESVPSSRAAELGLWLVPYSLASAAPQQLQRTQVQQYLLAPARTYGIIIDPAWGSERLNVTARVRVRAYRVGNLIRTAPHPPLPPHPFGAVESRPVPAATAVLLALRARPLSPPLLATVQSPCPGSHPHILFPWRVMPRPGVGLQLATRSHTFGPRGGAVGLAGDRSRAVPGPDVRSGRGELGTGAGLSETYLSTQSHRCPSPRGADTHTRTQDALHKAL